jgi:hypothetical protein
VIRTCAQSATLWIASLALLLITSGQISGWVTDITDRWAFSGGSLSIRRGDRLIRQQKHPYVKMFSHLLRSGPGVSIRQPQALRLLHVQPTTFTCPQGRQLRPQGSPASDARRPHRPLGSAPAQTTPACINIPFVRGERHWPAVTTPDGSCGAPPSPRPIAVWCSVLFHRSRSTQS